LSPQAKRALVDPGHPELSLTRQTQLLGISRSSLYYQPVVNQADIQIMHTLDEIYTEYPFYGSRRMKVELEQQYGITIGREHVQRLLRQMGVETIYPKKKIGLSDPNDQHEKYPYLLKRVTASHPNHIWGTDITYVKLEHGFAYLVAMLDWYSRYVIDWQLSDTLKIDFCIENLERALRTQQPLIHNSDQGSHFTSHRYTKLLLNQHVQISMDGRGRCMDNIFTERLWRTVKYENIYLQSYANLHTAQTGLTEYFEFYNTKRPHQTEETLPDDSDFIRY